jgi:hypothetical protein
VKWDDFSFFDQIDKKNEKLDDFMEYAVQQIRRFQGIYTQLDDFNEFVN